jgi:DNA-binding MarR family transcriptional regulator
MSLNREEAPSIGSVSALLAMDRTTLTANLKPLEHRGLVKVIIDDADKRTRRLKLTPAGRALLVAAVPNKGIKHRRSRSVTHESGPEPHRIR